MCTGNYKDCKLSSALNKLITHFTFIILIGSNVSHKVSYHFSGLGEISQAINPQTRYFL